MFHTDGVRRGNTQSLRCTFVNTLLLRSEIYVSEEQGIVLEEDKDQRTFFIVFSFSFFSFFLFLFNKEPACGWLLDLDCLYLYLVK